MPALDKKDDHWATSQIYYLFPSGMPFPHSCTIEILPIVQVPVPQEHLWACASNIIKTLENRVYLMFYQGSFNRLN